MKTKIFLHMKKTMKTFDGTIGREGAVYYVNAEWCGHCKRTRPVIEKLASELGHAIDVFDVNGDVWSEYLQRVLGPAAPTSYPTIFYIRNGVVREFDEDRTIENLRDFVCEHAGTC